MIAALSLAALLLASPALAAEPSLSTSPAVEALPAVVPGPSLTLSEALRAADQRNPTLATLRTELDRADAQLSTAWGLVLPMASAGLQATHADHADEFDMSASMAGLFEAMGLPAPESEPTVVRRQDEASGTVTASLSVINPSAWATIGTARRAADLTGLSVEDARQQLLLGVAQAWYATSMSHTLVALQEVQVQTAVEHLAVAEARHRAGTGLRIDVVRAETDLAQARRALLDAHLALDSSRDALAVLTGSHALPLPAAPPDLVVPLGTEEDLVAAALATRTDVLAARAQVDLARSQRLAVQMQFAPTVDLAWQGSYQFTEPTDMGSADRSRWTAVLSLNVPLYNHMRYGDLDAAAADLRRAELALADAEIQAGMEVRQALRDLQTAQAAVANAEQQAALAAEALELTRAAFAEGVGSSLEVTDARRTAAAAEVNLATTGLQAEVAVLSLLRAAGEDLGSL